MTTVRTCMALTAAKKLAVLKADADTAFVQAFIDKGVMIYVDQPPGHGDGTDRKMLLIKALYGLKQAALAWFEHCRKIVVGLGFRPSDYDPCLYLRQHGEELEMVATYVDDFLVFARTTAKANSILDELETKMKLKRQGEMSFFLGIKIEYDQNDGKITLTQEAYARKILTRFGMTTCNGQPSTDKETYRSMVGSLMYLMTCTRPDISHAVQRLSRHLHDPRVPHAIGAKRVLRYVKHTIGTGLGRQDLTDARQRVVALSTCEAEYVALAELAKEVVWLRCLLEDLSMRQDHPTLTWCDNKAAISTAENVGVASRSKHIDVRHHFIRQLIQAGVITSAPRTNSLTY
ncbi:hypothetical protein Ae201684P_010877 [Aphanomyces euteiches]|nr:hypothetical protein Ae201684P_010877 [Aphanomyces euteiches]